METLVKRLIIMTELTSNNDHERTWRSLAMPAMVHCEHAPFILEVSVSVYCRHSQTDEIRRGNFWVL